MLKADKGVASLSLVRVFGYPIVIRPPDKVLGDYMPAVTESAVELGPNMVGSEPLGTHGHGVLPTLSAMAV